MVQAGRACDEQLAVARQQDSVEYLANAYGFAPNPWSPYYYQPSRIPSIFLKLFFHRTLIIGQSITLPSF